MKIKLNFIDVKMLMQYFAILCTALRTDLWVLFLKLWCELSYLHDFCHCCDHVVHWGIKFLQVY